jgi:hypothetical protein
VKVLLTHERRNGLDLVEGCKFELFDLAKRCTLEMDRNEELEQILEKIDVVFYKIVQLGEILA